jgi:mannose-6-phosphate isomerase-like protein (cupin superfamily)
MYSENRPWGSFHVLDEKEGFKVKRIVVNPGGRLSLQSHKHRGEHWTVVNGTATITVGENVMTKTRSQSVDIPLGEKHRLENHGTDLVEIIEVQFGDYLGEDDIIRYDDVYNRS